MCEFGRAADPAETDSMARLLRESLERGAKGLSLGLEYPIANAAGAHELGPLFEAAGRAGGIVAVHVRNEDDGVLGALEEAFSLARAGNCKLIISHHKCAGRKNWGRSSETLGVIERAARESETWLDAYPYAVGTTVLMESLASISERAVVNSSVPMPEMVGLDVSEVAARLRCSFSEAVRRLSPATAFYHIMSEGDVDAILSHPLCMVGSDSVRSRNPHPRVWGTMTRFVSRFSRERKLVSLEEAVRKATGLCAEAFRLEGRGKIAEGAYADLVLFRKDELRDRSSFEDPTAPSEGIARVYVNGRLSWFDNKVTGVRAGRRLD